MGISIEQSAKDRLEVILGILNFSAGERQYYQLQGVCPLEFYHQDSTCTPKEKPLLSSTLVRGAT